MKKYFVSAMLVIMVITSAMLWIRVNQLECEIEMLKSGRVRSVPATVVFDDRNELGRTPDGRGTFRLLEPYSDRQ